MCVPCADNCAACHSLEAESVFFGGCLGGDWGVVGGMLFVWVRNVVWWSNTCTHTSGWPLESSWLKPANPIPGG